MYYYKYCLNKLPEYLQNIQIKRHSDIHSYPTRNRSQLLPEHRRTQMALKCIRHTMVKCVNSTPDAILNKVFTHSYQGFKNYIKQYILTNYKSTCDLIDCYVCRTVRGQWAIRSMYYSVPPCSRRTNIKHPYVGYSPIHFVILAAGISAGSWSQRQLRLGSVGVPRRVNWGWWLNALLRCYL